MAPSASSVPGASSTGNTSNTSTLLGAHGHAHLALKYAQLVRPMHLEDKELEFPQLVADELQSLDCSAEGARVALEADRKRFKELKRVYLELETRRAFLQLALDGATARKGLPDVSSADVKQHKDVVGESKMARAEAASSVKARAPALVREVAEYERARLALQDSLAELEKLGEESSSFAGGKKAMSQKVLEDQVAEISALRESRAALEERIRAAELELAEEKARLGSSKARLASAIDEESQLEQSVGARRESLQSMLLWINEAVRTQEQLSGFSLTAINATEAVVAFTDATAKDPHGTTYQVTLEFEPQSAALRAVRMTPRDYEDNEEQAIIRDAVHHNDPAGLLRKLRMRTVSRRETAQALRDLDRASLCHTYRFDKASGLLEVEMPRGVLVSMHIPADFPASGPEIRSLRTAPVPLRGVPQSHVPVTRSWSEMDWKGVAASVNACRSRSIPAALERIETTVDTLARGSSSGGGSDGSGSMRSGASGKDGL